MSESRPALREAAASISLSRSGRVRLPTSPATAGNSAPAQPAAMT